MQEELKFFDSGEGLAGEALSSTDLAYHNLICPTAQGATQSTVAGMYYRIKRIHWRIAVEIPPTSDDALTSDIVRVLLFIDHQVHGGVVADTGPAMDTVFEQKSNGFGTFWNKANEERFTFLLDKSIVLNLSMGSTTGAGLSGSSHGMCVGCMNVDIPVVLPASQDPRGNWVFLAGTCHNDAATWAVATRVEFYDDEY